MKENEGLVRERWPVTRTKEALLEKSEKETGEVGHVLRLAIRLGQSWLTSIQLVAAYTTS